MRYSKFVIIRSNVFRYGIAFHYEEVFEPQVLQVCLGWIEDLEMVGNPPSRAREVNGWADWPASNYGA